MPPKANRATWAGDAAAETDRAGRLIDRNLTRHPPEVQAPRLAAYVVDDRLLIVEVAYA